MSYIVPRKKPDRCTNCLFIDKITYDCKLMYGNDYPDFESQYKNCPLIEIPTPHGRLIDKDKLRHELFVNFNGERISFYDCDNFPTKIAYRDLHSILAEQKTVIEAEGRQRHD